MEGIKGIHFYFSKVDDSINNAIDDDSFKTVRFFFVNYLFFQLKEELKVISRKRLEEKKLDLCKLNYSNRSLFIFFLW